MHEDHRARMRERFLADGPEEFDAHQMLEMLLFYAIPRRDTNALAHRLIDRYGTLTGVFDADPAELQSVEGMGRNSVVLLTMIKPLWGLYRLGSMHKGQELDNFAASCRYAADLFTGRMNEAFYLLNLDLNCRLLRSVLICEGTVNEVSVHPRSIVEAAIRSHASKVILAHNHPNGSVQPSPEDISFTKRLSAALSTIGIEVVDHIIVCGDDTYSFAREGRADCIEGLGGLHKPAVYPAK